MNPNQFSDQDFWQQIHRERPISSIRKCEEAAKQLITLTSLLSTVYFSLLSFGSITSRLATLLQWFQLMLLIPLACWLTSLALAILVIMPREVNADPGDLPLIYEVASRSKYTLVRLSYLFLIASIVALTVLTIFLVFQPYYPVLIAPTPTPTP